MARTYIKIGVARKDSIERYPAHVVKISRRNEYQIWKRTCITDGHVIADGTMEEIKAWATKNGYKIIATNNLGRTLINA